MEFEVEYSAAGF